MSFYRALKLHTHTHEVHGRTQAMVFTNNNPLQHEHVCMYIKVLFSLAGIILFRFRLVASHRTLSQTALGTKEGQRSEAFWLTLLRSSGHSANVRYGCTSSLKQCRRRCPPVSRPLSPSPGCCVTETVQVETKMVSGTSGLYPTSLGILQKWNYFLVNPAKSSR